MRKFVGVFALLLAWQWPAAAETQQPVRVKCGGPAYTDSKGHAWSADFGFNGGVVSSLTGSVSDTPDPALFQHGRWSNSPALIYSFPVSNGSYQVNLYFAEMDKEVERVGGRVFNVKVDGTSAFSDLDVFATVGANKALIKNTTATVRNGNLKIEFDNVVDHAKVQAIEILPAAAAPTLMLNFKYPDGTAVSGVLNYVVSSSLLSFKGSQPLRNGQVQCELFANPSSLGISAQFQVNLSLTDADGHTLWQIDLGMNPAQVNLGTVQSSALNVVVQKL